MSARLDRVLDTIDGGLQSSDEWAGRVQHQDRCVGCQWREPKEGSSWCGPCHPVEPEGDAADSWGPSAGALLSLGNLSAAFVRLFEAMNENPTAWRSGGPYTHTFRVPDGGYSPLPATWDNDDEEVAW